MPTTEQFLASLDDFELAFLIRYKAASYLQGSQRKIFEEVKKRELDESSLEQLIKITEFNPANTGCPRCNSMKSYEEKYFAYRRNRVIDDAINGPTPLFREICSICGYRLRGFEKSQPLDFVDFFQLFQ